MADRSRAGEPLLLFTGGSLLVGAVGRTDLLGEENAIPYARAMFESLRDVILPHEDFVGVYPTHGAGSLCSTGIASTPWSTIGFERRHNPMVEPSDVDAFASLLLRDQPAFPRYFARMRPMNQAGPRLLGGRIPEPRPMSVDEVRTALKAGAGAAAMAPAVPATPSSSTSASPRRMPSPICRAHLDPVGLVVRDMARLGRRARSTARARPRLAGRVGRRGPAGAPDRSRDHPRAPRGGLPAWQGAGGPVAAGGRLSVDELASRSRRAGPATPLVIDVRQRSEYESGHVPGALHLAAGSLPDRLDELPRDRPIAMICASGYRSSVAASLLRSAGFTDVSWVADGLPAWRGQGHPVERGAPSEADSEPSGAGGDPALAAHRH